MRLALIFLSLFPVAPLSAGETKLFNGTDLAGWSGNLAFWSVKDGAIVGRTTTENPTKSNTFLIWKGGEAGDFTLTFKYRMTPGNEKKFANSGVQYRSKVIDEANFVVSGYQADFEYGEKFTGILYEEKGRKILAKRGQQVTITSVPGAKKPVVVTANGTTTPPQEIQDSIKKDDWNEIKIIAKGNHLQHYVNGKLSIDATDEAPEAAKTGVIALQLHAGPAMQVEFKDLVLITP